MHMSDALVSTPVAAAAGAVALALIGVAGRKVKKNDRQDLVPLMGVTGAFVFAAQMINFAIPGTGSSGHIVGGVLLAALLGPWAAFLTIVSVLVIQALVFADGGLLALGCNVVNMGACTCLLAYPLVFRPLLRFPAKPWKVMAVSILACVVGLELGALAVTAETELSGVTALPGKVFLGFMGSIHLAIGAGEGLATGAVLLFLQRVRPSILEGPATPLEPRQAQGGSDASPLRGHSLWSSKKVLLSFCIAAMALGGGLCFFASSLPDGLEWSVEQVSGSTELPSSGKSHEAAAGLQAKTAVMPDYDNSLSGIAGALVTLGLVWALGSLIAGRRKHALAAKHTDGK